MDNAIREIMQPLVPWSNNFDSDFDESEYLRKVPWSLIDVLSNYDIKSEKSCAKINCFFLPYINHHSRSSRLMNIMKSLFSFD